MIPPDAKSCLHQHHRSSKRDQGSVLTAAALLHCSTVLPHPQHGERRLAPGGGSGGAGAAWGPDGRAPGLRDTAMLSGAGAAGAAPAAHRSLRGKGAFLASSSRARAVGSDSAHAQLSIRSAATTAGGGGGLQLALVANGDGKGFKGLGELSAASQDSEKVRRGHLAFASSPRSTLCACLDLMLRHPWS